MWRPARTSGGFSLHEHGRWERDSGRRASEPRPRGRAYPGLAGLVATVANGRLRRSRNVARFVCRAYALVRAVSTRNIARINARLAYPPFAHNASGFLGTGGVDEAWISRRGGCPNGTSANSARRVGPATPGSFIHGISARGDGRPREHLQRLSRVETDLVGIGDHQKLRVQGHRPYTSLASANPPAAPLPVN